MEGQQPDEFRCSHCSQSFASRRRRNEHEKRKHGPVENRTCSYRFAVLENLSSLPRHVAHCPRNPSNSAECKIQVREVPSCPSNPHRKVFLRPKKKKKKKKNPNPWNRMTVCELLLPQSSWQCYTKETQSKLSNRLRPSRVCGSSARCLGTFLDSAGWFKLSSSSPARDIFLLFFWVLFSFSDIWKRTCTRRHVFIQETHTEPKLWIVNRKCRSLPRLFIPAQGYSR